MKRKRCVYKCCNFRRLKFVQERIGENFGICRPYNRNGAYDECKHESDTSKNRGNWNHLKTIHKTLEQCNGIPQNQETTENSHIGHCTHTAESTNVKEQNICNTRNNITCSTNCKYKAATTLCTLEKGFVSGILL